MKLIIQPGDGVAPVVRAIDKASRTIDIVIFRFDREEIVKALEAAVERGVVVRALIAHTNKGGEKKLRRLELRLLDCGATVARTSYLSVTSRISSDWRAIMREVSRSK